MYKFFKSPLPPSDLIAKFPQFADPEELNFKASSLYSGEKDVIARIDGTNFRAQRRLGIAWGLASFSPGFWFKPILSGSIDPSGTGSAVIFEGGTPIPMKVFWALVFVIVATAGSLLVAFGYPANINFDGPNSGTDMWNSIQAMNAALGVLILLPLIGWWLTRKDLAFIAAAVERNLQLHPVAKTDLD